MPSWDKPPPSNFNELFEFYHLYVKVLYDRSVNQIDLPGKAMHKLNIALDHLSTHWVSGYDEQFVVGRAYENLVVACFTIFRERVKRAKEQYESLCRLEISLINNGEFEKNLHQLFNQIREEEMEATRLESIFLDKVAALQQWEQVYESCDKLEQEFYYHPKLNWANKRGLKLTMRQHVIGFIIGVSGSALVAFVSWLLTRN